jgi:hypothetical protein
MINAEGMKDVSHKWTAGRHTKIRNTLIPLATEK